MNWPLYVIGLNGTTGRRASLVQALDARGIEWRLSVAIDGRKGLDPRYELMVDRAEAQCRLGRALTDPEIACALSHQACYREIIDRDLPGAIILEDDAQIGDRFEQFITRNLYRHHHFIQLYYGKARIWRHGIGRSRLSDALSAERLVHNSAGTVAYSVSRTAASYLIQHSLPLSLPADWPCDLSPLKPVVCLPRIVGHPIPAEDQSDIVAARYQARHGAKPQNFLMRSRKNKNRPPWWFRFARRHLVSTIDHPANHQDANE